MGSGGMDGRWCKLSFTPHFSGTDNSAQQDSEDCGKNNAQRRQMILCKGLSILPLPPGEVGVRATWSHGGRLRLKDCRGLFWDLL